MKRNPKYLRLFFCLATWLGALGVSMQADAIDIALLGATSDVRLDEVRDNLLATGKFSIIAKFDVGTLAGTPTLAELNQYDAVLVWSSAQFYRGPTPGGEYFPLANRLADYIDGGGGVVLGLFSYSHNYRLHGDFRFEIPGGGYYALLQNGGSVSAVPHQTLGVYNASHPVMSGVSSFASGPNTFLTSRTPHPDATVVATLSNGDPLVVERTIGDARRIDLAFYPISAPTVGISWDPSTDGTLIIANSLVYVANLPTVTVLDLMEGLIITTSAINTKNGILNALDSKLDNIMGAWVAENADSRNDVLSKLSSFINQVEAQRDKAISNADADILSDAAREIVALILSEG